MTPEAALAYCAEEVRRHDHDRYLCALFAPETRRPALQALAAFNVTLAQATDGVSEPLLGQVRLQWWRDVVEALDGPPPDHPVAIALAESAKRWNLPSRLLDRLIEARLFDLAGEAPADLAVLEGYAEATAGTLAALMLAALGVDGDPATETAARRVGVAWALIGLVRATPYLAARGRVMMPVDRLAAAGTTPEDVLRDGAGPALGTVARELVERADALVAEARSERRRIDGRALPALLPAVLADLYVKKLRRHDYDSGATAEGVSGPRRQLRLLVRAALGRY